MKLCVPRSLWCSWLWRRFQHRKGWFKGIADVDGVGLSSRSDMFLFTTTDLYSFLPCSLLNLLGKFGGLFATFGWSWCCCVRCWHSVVRSITGLPTLGLSTLYSTKPDLNHPFCKWRNLIGRHFWQLNPACLYKVSARVLSSVRKFDWPEGAHADWLISRMQVWFQVGTGKHRKNKESNLQVRQLQNVIVECRSTKWNARLTESKWQDEAKEDMDW